MMQVFVRASVWQFLWTLYLPMFKKHHQGCVRKVLEPDSLHAKSFPTQCVSGGIWGKDCSATDPGGAILS